ncbi:MAG: pyruvate formate lyase family protein [Thermodesulfobacteriota bacterium]
MNKAVALSDELKMLRDGISIKLARNVRQGYEKDENTRGMYRDGVRLNVERNRLLTESYKATEGEPMVLRRAKALSHILRNMSIFIVPQSRIVGHSGSTPHDLYYPIEVNWLSPWRALNSEDARNLLDDKGREEMKEIVEYWKGKTLSDIRKEAFKGDLEKFFKYEGTFLWSHWDELGVPNYEKLLTKGVNGIKKEAEEKLNKVIETIPDDYLEQCEFLKAVIITLEATIVFAQRYTQKAKEEAASEKNEARKKQLEEIARICTRVPAQPATTYYEALQSFWFVNLISRQIELVSLGCGARFDILFDPYYQKDVAEGRITREEAVELMQHLLLKFEEAGMWYSPMITGIYGGVQQLEGITLGGQDARGHDITNEMTYIVLEASRRLHILQPTIALRVHKNTPKELLAAATDLIRTGCGYPSLFNDEVIMPLLRKWKVAEEDIHKYSSSGCVYLEIPGKNQVRRASGYFVLPKCLWWALHQGVNPKTGEQYGAPTPDPETFTDIREVMDAYLEQVRFFFGKMVKLESTGRGLYQRYAPRPFLSAFLDGCLEQGKEARRWAYPSNLNSFNLIIGPTNVADSLAAIQKLVFDDRELTMREFIAILDRNWEGHEDLRQRVITRIPKFGNDDDYVDLLAKEVHERTEEVIQEFKDEHGLNYHGDGSAVSATYGLSRETPATPDGRKDGEPFADATLSPMIGRDTNGPTAVLASCAKIDPLKGYNQLLNQKFPPKFLDDEHKDVFLSYLRSWCEMKVPHIQFNVVDRNTLIDAQKHPEKHGHLIVRVAGYSTYFVDLSKGLQDHIIARSEQGF